jgi:N-acetylglucosaminyl-diphospho-decaprenol L-rhamnosyltransferase
MADTSLTLDDVTVIIVTYNSAHCVDALATDLMGFANILISDNGSEDGTCDAVRRQIPQAQILAHGRNLGFGAANNRALEKVRTRFAMLLNPDCQIHRDATLGMLAVFENYPQAAAVAPQLLRANGSLEISYRWPATLWRSKGSGADAPCCVGFVCAAAIMLRLKETGDVGRFDEDFFLYYEDEDLCLRLFQSQRNIILAPHIKLTHSSRGSVRGKHPLRAEYGRGYHHAFSKILFAKKHMGITQAKALCTKTRWLARLGLLPRMLLPVPRLVARWLGRMAGLAAASRSLL